MPGERGATPTDPAPTHREPVDPLDGVAAVTGRATLARARQVTTVRDLAPPAIGRARSAWHAAAAGWSGRHTVLALLLTPALAVAYDWASRTSVAPAGYGPVALAPIGALAAALLASYLPVRRRGDSSARPIGSPCATGAAGFAVLAVFPLAAGGPGAPALAAALLVMGLAQRLLGSVSCRG